jgi:hypothetical protein
MLEMDLSGSEIFGFLCRGAHGLVYTYDGEEIMIWAQIRGGNQSQFPGKYDDTVATHILVGENPELKLEKKARTEASLVGHKFTHTGTVTYFMSQTINGRPGSQKHCQLRYELKAPPGFKPYGSDNEVSGFELMTFKEAMRAIVNEEVAAWRALGWIYFFIHHGCITEQNEPNFKEIISRIQVDFGPTPQVGGKECIDIERGLIQANFAIKRSRTSALCVVLMLAMGVLLTYWMTFGHQLGQLHGTRR